MERLVKLLFFVGLAVYFVVLVVARTPAQWGAWVALQAAPGLALSGVSGTLWSGRVAAAQVHVNGQTLNLGGLNWSFSPLSLLALRACVQLDSANLRGTVCRSLTGINSAKQLLVDQLPANLLDASVGAQLGGAGGMTLRHATVTDAGVIKALDGSVNWQRARINVGTGWFALGSYAADLSANGNGGLRADIFDLEGDFTVQLQAEYTLNQEPRVNGLITPKDSAPQPLRDALSLFTEMLDDGSHRVTWPLGG